MIFLPGKYAPDTLNVGQRRTGSPVDEAAVVVATGAQRQKVLSGLGHLVAVDFDFEVAQISVQRHRLGGKKSVEG